MKLNLDYVICPICSVNVKRLATNGHLRKHKITSAELKIKFPGVNLTSSAYNDKIISSNVGRILSKESRDKISQGNKGQKAWNKGLSKFTDSRVANYSNKTSITRKAKLRDGTLIHNSLGIKRTLESRNKMRLARINNILKNNKTWPSYNKNACKFFEYFDLKADTIGVYAGNPNEFLIKDLGYWLDYINFSLKIIIEWDEDHHFEKSGELTKRDIIRQEEIQRYFSEYKFIRIRHSTMIENYGRLCSSRVDNKVQELLILLQNN